MMSKVSTVVIEDQPIVWDYIRSCLEDFCEIEAFCTSTTDATKAIKQIQPKLPFN